jgi:hypothetical protein
MANISLNHHIHHITQQDENYCWACALAMLKGERTWEQALAVADRVPESARDRNSGALINPAAAAHAVHLRARRVTQLTPVDLVSDLRRGPVAIFGVYRLERVFRHVMVLSLMIGDTALPHAVRVGIDDPWASGNRWIGPWSAFCGAGRTLIGPEYVVSR